MPLRVTPRRITLLRPTTLHPTSPHLTLHFALHHITRITLCCLAVLHTTWHHPTSPHPTPPLTSPCPTPLRLTSHRPVPSRALQARQAPERRPSHAREGTGRPPGGAERRASDAHATRLRTSGTRAAHKQRRHGLGRRAFVSLWAPRARILAKIGAPCGASSEDVALWGRERILPSRPSESAPSRKMAPMAVSGQARALSAPASRMSLALDFGHLGRPSTECELECDH